MSFASINPYTEQLLASYRDSTDAEVEQALATADTTFRADWRMRSFADRAAVVRRAAALLRERRDDLAALATREMGKLVAEARAEVETFAAILEFYAEHAEAQLQPRRLDAGSVEAWVENEPLGVILAIEPWNEPYYQVARVAGPNLMAGNTVVVKHAPGVPQCALAVEQLFLDAGAPAGAYTNLFVPTERIAAIIADQRVRGVALTGSDRAGAAVAAEAGTALKKSTMELGGSDAFIVLQDADVTEAVRLAVEGRMRDTGQACAASKRFVVHTDLADAFVDGFRAALSALVPGDPMDPDTTLGPLSSQQALDRVLEQIEAAERAGAQVVTGGQRLDRPGFFLAPTILDHVNTHDPAFGEEFFAPVALLLRAADDDEAVAIANASPYGLGGSVISPDLERARAVAKRMETGMVFLNSAVQSAPELPFGGIKGSGYGRELSDLGIREFVNAKLLTVSPGRPQQGPASR